VPQVAQEANQMQTVVNLVSAGLGVAWVSHSERQFQRPGVSYRDLRAKDKRRADPLGAHAGGTRCETSLVWAVGNDNPALARFVAFVRARLPADPGLPADPAA